MQIYANDATAMLSGLPEKECQDLALDSWPLAARIRVSAPPSCGKHPSTSLKSCCIEVSVWATRDKRREWYLNCKCAVLFNLCQCCLR